MVFGWGGPGMEGRAPHAPGRAARAFRLAYSQTESLIGSVIGLLGLDLAVPDHTALCRRAETLEVPGPRRPGAGAGGDVLDARDSKLCDTLDAVDNPRRSLDRQERREELLAGFDRQRANKALGRLGTPTTGAAP